MAPSTPSITAFPYTTLFRSRDEHETKADIVREADNSYLVPGNMDVDRLDQLFGVRLDGHEATTVAGLVRDRKSTRLNSSHMSISYAVFCLNKKNPIIPKNLQ